MMRPEDDYLLSPVELRKAALYLANVLQLHSVAGKLLRLAVIHERYADDRQRREEEERRHRLHNGGDDDGQS